MTERLSLSCILERYSTLLKINPASLAKSSHPLQLVTEASNGHDFRHVIYLSKNCRGQQAIHTT